MKTQGCVYKQNESDLCGPLFLSSSVVTLYCPSAVLLRPAAGCKLLTHQYLRTVRVGPRRRAVRKVLAQDLRSVPSVGIKAGHCRGCCSPVLGRRRQADLWAH